MARRGVRGAAASVLVAGVFCLCAASVFSAENSANLRFRFGGEYSIPILGDEAFYSSGYQGSVGLEYVFFPLLSPIARVAVSSLALKNVSPISVYEGSIGLSSRIDFAERFFARAEVSGGLFRAAWGDKGSNGISGNARAEIGFRLSPAFRLAGDFGVFRFFQGSGSLYTGIVAGLNFSVFPEGFDAAVSRLKIEAMDLFPVFPVFYSYYDDHPFGYAQLRNGEDAMIRDVRVSFYAPDYMSKPTECVVFDSIAKGDTVRIPLTALFNEKILQLTERTKTRCDMIVEYRMIGSKREFRKEIDLTVYHRNAMTWSDDRHAAAFVSGKDPAVLWFSRFVNAVVRDRFRVGIDKNLQQAVGIFEAMKLFGLAYVVDPASSYADNADNQDVIDYLQFPYQTLFYRGGDCDDLSILFSSLLQSVGIETAFITIPGHIYMAFATEMTEETARRDFYDPDLLVYKNGKVWIPVEITMVKDGFVKAWRVGAKEWVDNVRIDKANFYPMPDSWKTYPPVGIPDVNPRFQLPDEALTMKAFDMALDRHIAREIEPRVKELKKRLAAEPSSPETENAIGLAYARAGMLTEAWTHFSAAAQKGYLPAWTNLANVAYIRKDYNLARDYYRYALDRAEYDPASALGIARCEYELERFSAAEAAYGELKSLDADLAKRYSYLASMFGGSGRAWSLADRAGTVEWVDKARSRPAAPETRVAAAVPTVAAPAPVPAAKPEAPVSIAAAAPVNTATPVAEPEKPLPESSPPAPAAVVPVAVPAAAEPKKPESPPPVAAPAFIAEPVAPAPIAKPEPPKVAPIIAEAAPEDADLKEREIESARVKQVQAAAEPAREMPPAVIAAAPKPPAEAPKPVPPKQERKNSAVSAAPSIASAAPVDADLKEREAESARVKRENERVEQVRPEAPLPAAVVNARPEAPKSEPLKQIVQQEPKKEPANISTPAAAVPEKADQPEQKPAPLPAASQSPQPAAPVAETAPVAVAAAAVPKAPSAAAAPMAPPAAPVVTVPPSAVVAVTPKVPAAAAAPVTPAAPPAKAVVSVTAAAPPVVSNASAAFLAGFDGFKVGPGSWTLNGNKAVQQDPLQMYAKIASVLPSSAGAVRISFGAKATGYMWTGFGVHFLGDRVRTLKGYGAGSSYLVWFTSDARNYPDNSERVQFYRSFDDSYMEMILDAPLSVSLRDKHSYAVESDPVTKNIRVLVDGKECLRASMGKKALSGPGVIFRALDMAELYDFRAESIQRE